ncbi:MAG: hypothetical protein K2P78_02575 [Gemmataceae bacterium]|nr:hypothetical protein [Gemmataceae bacterium]
MAYPPALERLHAALASLPGVSDVCSGIESLQGLTGDDLRFPDFAHVPHGALRRTNGGLTGEALVQVEFRIAATAAGWRSLEFIAWFVRDQARGGVFIQLRPFALPPMYGDQVQLGHTLKWHIDLFCPDTGEDLSPQLAKIDGIAAGLELAINLYGPLIGGSADAEPGAAADGGAR